MRHKLAPKVRQEMVGVDRESDLHNDIAAYCRSKGWVVVSSRFGKPSMNKAGVADFIIFASNGRVIVAEAKTRTGKQSSEQKGFQMMLEINGHRYHLVRSMADFLEAIGIK